MRPDPHSPKFEVAGAIVPVRRYDGAVQRWKGFDMRRILIATAVLGGLAVTACNTVEGAGKDVSSAGKAVARTANKAK